MRRTVEPFRFKQFEVKHTDSTLAVGTDALLLASWVCLEDVFKVLEVGTGCGLISLAIAQRIDAAYSVLAIDIDDLSVREAQGNFLQSPWWASLESKLINFEELKIQALDLIISNPPFFRNALINKEDHKVKARHQEEFSMSNFAEFCSTSLSSTGTVALVYPFSDFEFLQQEFEFQGLYLKRYCKVQPKESKPANRILVEFTAQKQATIQEERLCIREEDNTYTERYKYLTKEYYLAH